MVQVLREIQLMKELNAKQGSQSYIPQLYDVLVHEDLDWSSGEPVSKPTVFLVMEHFETDMREFIAKKIRDLNEKQVL